MAVQTFYKSTDGETYISKNFQVKEFCSGDGADQILIDVDFVRDKLQAIRSYYDMPVRVNSGYRTPERNAKVGGAKNSYHMKGQAFDIVVQGIAPKDVARVACMIKIKGIVLYPGFVHVDSRDAPYYAISRNGKFISVNGF